MRAGAFPILGITNHRYFFTWLNAASSPLLHDTCRSEDRGKLGKRREVCIHPSTYDDCLPNVSRMYNINEGHKSSLNVCAVYETLVVQPGMFRTNSLTDNSHRSNVSDLEDYAVLNDHMALAKSKQGKQRGDPVKMVMRVIDVVKGTGFAEGRSMPETLPMGNDAVRAIRQKCERTLRNLQYWEDMSCGTDY